MRYELGSGATAAVAAIAFAVVLCAAIAQDAVIAVYAPTCETSP